MHTHTPFEKSVDKKRKFIITAFLWCNDKLSLLLFTYADVF
ncbi:hypothetical protein HMPREF0373_00744 [Eubacterium ramulus ATCC 29099]|uniref:Uncharacterized protein n=1 Tax=Eubacterium ramulus ATCC 29099 TaxID=1256908 RepID=U2RIE8_EUBRA|nr:hypothetical protein HMPREF0373_00744 [Eubacterium ramulus ATCC 29099]